MKRYVVYKGKVLRVYDEWDDCLEQANEFSGNSYKWYRNHLTKNIQLHIFVTTCYFSMGHKLQVFLPILILRLCIILHCTDDFF
jgi:hypothetical protein